jgi:hypothetical protein
MPDRGEKIPDAIGPEILGPDRGLWDSESHPRARRGSPERPEEKPVEVDCYGAIGHDRSKGSDWGKTMDDFLTIEQIESRYAPD